MKARTRGEGTSLWSLPHVSTWGNRSRYPPPNETGVQSSASYSNLTRLGCAGLRWATR